MTTTNTAGRSLAIAAGVVLASGTLAILFEDVLMHGAQFTLKHWLTLVTVAGTMMVGHLADTARRHRHWMSVAGFTALFLAGTGLVVYSSVGRQAEKTLISSVEHDQLVAQRIDLKKQVEDERKSVQEKRDAADAECATGIGNQCKAKRATVVFYENSLKGLEARLQVLDAPKPVSAEAEQFANVAAALGYDKDQVRALAILLAPFFTTLFLEFGTIVSFGFAFSPKRVVRTVRQPSPSDTLQTSFAAPDSEIPDAQRLLGPSEVVADARKNPDRPGRGYGPGGLKAPDRPKRPGPKSGEPWSKEEVEQYVVTELAFGRSIPSQQALKELSGRPKQTISDWVREWTKRGIIPAPTPNGRCKMVVAE